MSPAILACIILAITVFMFFHPKFPNSITATVGAILMALTGFVDLKTVFNYYTSSACILMIGMMIIGGGIFHTGFAGLLGRNIIHFTGKSEKGIQFIAIIAGWLLSSICSGSASMMILYPIFCSICMASNVSMSRVMLPMFSGIGFGTFMTVAGGGMGPATSAILVEAGFKGWGFFEPAMFGAPKAVLGIAIIMLVGHRLLPKTHVMPNEAEAVKADSIPTALTGKMIISGVILMLTIIGMVIDSPICPMYMCAAIGAMASVLTGCLSEKQMFNSISWTTIFMIGGMTAVAKGVQASGLGQNIADSILNMTGSNTSPIIMVLILFIVTGIITQFMSNNAAAAIMAPIGIVVAKNMGIEPYAFVAAAYFGSAIGMCTPMATPSLAFIMEAGRYSPKDVLKWGLLEVVFSLIAAIIFIPLAWL